ncbi:MAG: sulfatase-like hydrolase/transferase [Verrucomicrobiales bacterium]|nr:sulfatase-like hydrolase/transferase [Verrucomicrobiales bacterium]
MSVRSFILLGAALIMATVAPRAAQPNILFVLVDDLGWGDLGVFFQQQRAAANDPAEPWHFTPKLDGLANEGIRLTHHYCPAPVCAPSRASLLLGVHQGHANVRDNQFDKGLAANHTLATVLRQAGYATVAIGKWGLQGDGAAPRWEAHPLARGFDDYFGYIRHVDGHEHYPKEGKYRGTKEVYANYTNLTPQLDKCYTADLFTARAKHWITAHAAAQPDRPFFMYLAYDTPHAVIELPTMAYPDGGGLDGGLQWRGVPGAMINTAGGVIDSYYHPDYASRTYDPGDGVRPWPDVYQRYATCVRRLDDCVGDLVQLLKDLRLDDNTLVVFTSDNGNSAESYLAESFRPDFFNGFGPFDGIKRDCWEGGVRVPLIARWPARIPAGRFSRLPSSFPDWLPTFAEMAGLPAPARTDGVSLLPTLTGAGIQRTPTVYVEYFQGGTTPGYDEFARAHRGRRRNQMQVLRDGDFVGVRYDIGGPADDFEIYDVANDPQELRNLGGDPAFAARQQAMQDRVLRLRRPEASAPRPYDAEPVPALAITQAANGVVWQAYEGDFPWVPEFTQLPAAARGTNATPSVEVRATGTPAGLLFTGYLRAPVTGDYTFHLATDTGALLRLHEATLIDADFGHAAGSEVTGDIRLAAGLHPFRLYYRHGAGQGAGLTLEWRGPGFDRQAVPPAAFFIDGVPGPRPPDAQDDQARTPQNQAITIEVLANDGDDGTPEPLQVTHLETPRAGTARVDDAQRVTYTPRSGFLGEDRFRYTISDGDQSAGAEVRVDVFFPDDEYWFPFNQLEGMRTGSAAGNRSISLLGYAGAATPWVAGRFGRGLSLDGATQLGRIEGFPGFLETAPRTVAAWIKTTAGNAPIVGWGPKSPGEKWIFLVHGTGQLRVEIEGGFIVGNTVVNDGRWHHVACTFADDGSPNVTDVKLYVDGEAQTPTQTGSQTVRTGAAGEVLVGSDVQGRHFSGGLDELRLFPRALGPGEVKALAVADHQSAAAWHRRHFGMAPVDWQTDDDGDGAPRLLEYALGGQPWLADAAELALQPEVAGDRLQLRSRRLLNGVHELVYALEISPDLTAWMPERVGALATAPWPGRPDLEEVHYQIERSVTGAAALYVRLRVALL